MLRDRRPWKERWHKACTEQEVHGSRRNVLQSSRYGKHRKQKKAC